VPTHVQGQLSVLTGTALISGRRRGDDEGKGSTRVGESRKGAPGLSRTAESARAFWAGGSEENRFSSYSSIAPCVPLFRFLDVCDKFSRSSTNFGLQHRPSRIRIQNSRSKPPLLLWALLAMSPPRYRPVTSYYDPGTTSKIRVQIRNRARD
jgi:hypothetical protein